jgi:translation initiation factor IF-3
MAIRPSNPTLPPRNEDGPRINGQIRVDKVRLIGADGEMVGVVTTREAQAAADEAGLDLVEISPNAEPPVAKILDYGKFKYEEQKKANEARKKQKIIDVKELKLRPMIGDHDYEVKMRAARKFLEDGDKVKFTMRFRGRELSHQELGLKVLQQAKLDLAELSKVESEPRMEGRQMIMMLSSNKV